LTTQISTNDAPLDATIFVLQTDYGGWNVTQSSQEWDARISGRERERKSGVDSTK